MPTAEPALRDPLPHSACCTTEKLAALFGTFFICGVQSVMVGTEPLVRTDISAVFNRNDRGTIGTNPSLAGCAESRLRRIVNGGTKAIPGIVRRTDFVLTVYLIARRTFPTVHARRIRRIDAVATVFAAPTVLIRAGVGLQMPEFAPGMLFVDVTVPRVVVRKDRFIAGRIINGVTGLAEPITLQTDFRE